MTDTKICPVCEQPVRPNLVLKQDEKQELELALEKGWREWAQKVLELSEPELLSKRTVLQDMIDGTITNEEAMKRLGMESDTK